MVVRNRRDMLDSRYSTCWLADLMKARNNDDYNNLGTVDGEVGSGKSTLSLQLGQYVDPWFGARNLVYTKPEFYGALRRFKGKRATIVWDECGTAISHRTWQKQEQIDLMSILQGMRYRHVNVFFVLPDRNLMDIVARNLCHFWIHMIDRGVAVVKRIVKTGDPFRPILTPILGYVYSEMPTAMMWDTFTKTHTEHMDEFIDKAEERMLARMQKAEKQMQKDLHPEATAQDLFEKAKLILPECINKTRVRENRIIEQGLIKRTKVQEKLGIDSNAFYELRPKLLEYVKSNPQILRKENREE